MNILPLDAIKCDSLFFRACAAWTMGQSKEARLLCFRCLEQQRYDRSFCHLANCLCLLMICHYEGKLPSSVADALTSLQVPQKAACLLYLLPNESFQRFTGRQSEFLELVELVSADLNDSWSNSCPSPAALRLTSSELEKLALLCLHFNLRHLALNFALQANVMVSYNSSPASGAAVVGRRLRLTDTLWKEICLSWWCREKDVQPHRALAAAFIKDPGTDNNISAEEICDPDDETVASWASDIFEDALAFENDLVDEFAEYSPTVTPIRLHKSSILKQPNISSVSPQCQDCDAPGSLKRVRFSLDSMHMPVSQELAYGGRSNRRRLIDFARRRQTSSAVEFTETDTIDRLSWRCSSLVGFMRLPQRTTVYRIVGDATIFLVVLTVILACASLSFCLVVCGALPVALSDPSGRISSPQIDMCYRFIDRIGLGRLLSSHLLQASGEQS